MEPMRVWGIGACRAGWVAVELRDGGYATAYLAPTLAEQGVVVPEEPGRAGLAAPDDVLDAVAVAGSAYRIGSGNGTGVPAVPEQDRNGRPIAIWY
jgi:predicted RNase H-like nuclease